MKRTLKIAVSAFLTAAAVTLSLASSASAADTGLLGDVNNDGKVTSSDSLMVLRHSVKAQLLSDTAAKYADFDGNGQITAADALLILRKAVGADEEMSIYVPSQLKLQCGDRTDLDVTVTPASKAGDITFQYTLDKAISTDGSGEHVLEMTNLGKIKAYHPGTSVVTVKASNGETFKCTVTVENTTTSQTVTAGGNSLKITRQMMTRNDCYKYSDDYNIKGIVVHSTATPGVKAATWYAAWNKSYEKGEIGTEVAVHAFLDDEGVYQYLPYEQQGWHVGGSANRTHIGFEICEPSGFYYSNNIITGYNVNAQQAYFDKIWKNSTTYCAYLCNEYDLSVDNIISHKEANTLGLGSAHGDPDHWFILHGKTMNDFRSSVRALLNSRSGVTVSESIEVPEIDIQSSGSPFDGTVPEFDMFDVWGDNSRSLRD